MNKLFLNILLVIITTITSFSFSQVRDCRKEYDKCWEKCNKISIDWNDPHKSVRCFEDCKKEKEVCESRLPSEQR